MSETAQEPHPYLEQHPNAVEDVAKAQFMAEAMDPHEAKAAQLRQELTATALQAAAETDSYHHNKPLVGMGAIARSGDLTQDIVWEQRMSDRKAGDMADIYDAIEATKR